MDALQLVEDKRQHIFTWKVGNILSSTKKRNSSVKSPLFVAASLNRTTWYLSLFPRGTEWTEDVACFLTRYEEDRTDNEIDCKFRLNLIGADDLILVSYGNVAKFKKGSYHGSYSFFDREFLKRNLKESKKTLTIQCVIKITKSKAILRSENEAFTSIAIDRSSFTWTSKLLDGLNSSETIKSHPIISSSFTLALKVIDDLIKLRIRRIKDFFLSLSMVCKVTLLDVTGQATLCSSDVHLFETCDQYTLDLWTFPDFLKKSFLFEEREKFLRANQFTLQFEVSVSRGETSKSIKEKQSNYSTSVNSSSNVKVLTELQSCFRSLYNCKLFTDVILNCEEQTFPAHKCILISRSPVFRAMFCQDMMETKTSSVDISDLEAETLDSLLEFLYTGNVRFLDSNKAIKLLVASDKYEVLQLKEECACFLEDVLNEENICDILISVDFVQVEALRVAAIKYVKKNRESIFKSEEWTYLVREYPSLAAQTVLEVSSSVGSRSEL